MRPLRPKNTKEEGLMEFMVYPGEDSRFIGVCLTFDIVEEGVNAEEVMRSIQKAAELHLETVCEKNLSDDLLNRYAPEEYWDKYLEFQEMMQKPREMSLSTPMSASVQRLYNSLTPVC